ncbi:hypothetical protein M9H77_16923 [Catharanthus roseus]|uniref:Uncharacterized protein n=1 Tax=Catharanthus roseus TaxID=4058 RepID=A0ACC0B339_CATRO|nr:hypothetical protein M9H77_16923 [Catharanthus roseus]
MNAKDGWPRSRDTSKITGHELEGEDEVQEGAKAFLVTLGARSGTERSKCGSIGRLKVKVASRGDPIDRGSVISQNLVSPNALWLTAGRGLPSAAGPG